MVVHPALVFLLVCVGQRPRLGEGTSVAIGVPQEDTKLLATTSERSQKVLSHSEQLAETSASLAGVKETEDFVRDVPSAAAAAAAAGPGAARASSPDVAFKCNGEELNGFDVVRNTASAREQPAPLRRSHSALESRTPQRPALQSSPSSGGRMSFTTAPVIIPEAATSVGDDHVPASSWDDEYAPAQPFRRLPGAAAGVAPERAQRSKWVVVVSENAGSGLQLLPAEPRPRRRRHRRSWLWNQFFVIEEYRGPEPVLIGRLHTDMDLGDGHTKYTLEGEGVGSVFVIDGKTGNIHVTKSLDREEKDQYRLVATATDRQTGHALEPSSQFIIRVQDINDNPPVFPDEPYVATVPEMANIGTSVIQVTASDADDPTYGNSARLVYAITQGQDYFSVDAQTGVLRTAVPDMDRETQDEYLVVLQAKDMGGHLGGLSGTTTVTVRLTDVNDNPPRFRRSVWSFSISELAAPGVEVGRLTASDGDLEENALLDFSVLDSGEADTFNITGKDREAVIVLNKILDYESRATYSFSVEVTNPVVDPRYLRKGPFKDRAAVRVMVLNADEPPRFSRPRYRLDVSENCPPVCSVGRVSAVDPDTGQDGNIRYSIDPQSDPEALFRIASDTGSISTVMELDREREQWHNITVIATQRDNPNLVTRVVVAIETLDQNDNAPELDRQYATSVCDSSTPGQVVQVVRAVDKDQGGQNIPVHFSIPPESSSALNLTIRESGGVTASLVLQSSLEPLGGASPSLLTLYVPVVLRDGASGLTNTGTVTVTICPCQSGGMQTEDRGRQRDKGWERHAVCLPLPSASPSLIFSMVTVLALLACVTTLLVVCALSLSLRRPKRDPHAPLEEDDVRENIITYDDEGGGEADTAAFDMATLQSMHRVQHMQRDSRNIWYTQPNPPRSRTYSWSRNPAGRPAGGPLPEPQARPPTRPGSAPLYGRFCYGMHTLPVLRDYAHTQQGPLEAGSLQLTRLSYGGPPVSGAAAHHNNSLVIQNQHTLESGGGGGIGGVVRTRPAHAGLLHGGGVNTVPGARRDAPADKDGGGEANSDLKWNLEEEAVKKNPADPAVRASAPAVALVPSSSATLVYRDPSVSSSSQSQASSSSSNNHNPQEEESGGGGRPGSSQTQISSTTVDDMDTDSSVPSVVSERKDSSASSQTGDGSAATKPPLYFRGGAAGGDRDTYSIIGSLNQSRGGIHANGTTAGPGGSSYPGGAQQLLDTYRLGKRDQPAGSQTLPLPGGMLGYGRGWGGVGGGQQHGGGGASSGPERPASASSLPLRMEDFLKFRLDRVTFDPSQPPYDSLQTYEFEGRDSRAESLSSLESEEGEGEKGEEGEGGGEGGGAMDELNQKFQRLVEIIKEREWEKEKEREQQQQPPRETAGGEAATPAGDEGEEGDGGDRGEEAAVPGAGDCGREEEEEEAPVGDVCKQEDDSHREEDQHRWDF